MYVFSVQFRNCSDNEVSDRLLSGEVMKTNEALSDQTNEFANRMNEWMNE